jgi:hypothetical protein
MAEATIRAIDTDFGLYNEEEPYKKTHGYR